MKPKAHWSTTVNTIYLQGSKECTHESIKEDGTGEDLAKHDVVIEMPRDSDSYRNLHPNLARTSF